MVHTNWDLMSGLLDSFETYVLRCDLDSWETIRVSNGEVIAQWQFGSPWRSDEPADSPRRMALRSLLRVINIDIVHIRTLIATGPEILTSLAGMGVRIVFSFHDFATICPTIQLIDNNSRFCGGLCTPGDGRCRVAARWFGDVYDLKHRNVYRWRERMAACLPLANAFVTTTESTKSFLIEHFPMLSTREFSVIEHGRNREGKVDAATEPDLPLKIVTFGALNPAKGIHLMNYHI